MKGKCPEVDGRAITNQYPRNNERITNGWKHRGSPKRNKLEEKGTSEKPDRSRIESGNNGRNETGKRTEEQAESAKSAESAEQKN